MFWVGEGSVRPVEYGRVSNQVQKSLSRVKTILYTSETERPTSNVPTIDACTYGFLSTCWACSANEPVTSTCSASGLGGKLHLWPYLFWLKFENFTSQLSTFCTIFHESYRFRTFWLNFGHFSSKLAKNFVKMAQFLRNWPKAP